MVKTSNLHHVPYTLHSIPVGEEKASQRRSQHFLRCTMSHTVDRKHIKHTRATTAAKDRPVSCTATRRQRKGSQGLCCCCCCCCCSCCCCCCCCFCLYPIAPKQQQHQSNTVLQRTGGSKAAQPELQGGKRLHACPCQHSFSDRRHHHHCHHPCSIHA